MGHSKRLELGMDQQKGTLELCSKRCILHIIRFYICANPVMENCDEADQHYVLSTKAFWASESMKTLCI